MVGSLVILWHGSLVTASIDADGAWHFPEDRLRSLLNDQFGPDPEWRPTPSDQLDAAAVRLAGEIVAAPGGE